jgi:hypothetical protein
MNRSRIGRGCQVAGVALIIFALVNDSMSPLPPGLADYH